MIDEYYDDDDIINSEEEIVGYCKYCKDEVFAGEDFIKKNGDIFHEFCFKQLHAIDDPYE